MAPNQDREFSFQTRQKHWAALQQSQTPFDVFVVGGGIVGAGILCELARRGLTRTLLVEKNDFASGTSSASTKLVHAGIRYLEQAWVRLKRGQIQESLRQFGFVFNASLERKKLTRLYPHLIKSKTIHLVLENGDKRTTPSVVAGIWLYYLIQIVQGQFFPFPRFYFGKNRIQGAFPELDANKVKALFTFTDSETDDARLVIDNLQLAHHLGALALNQVELMSYEVQGDIVVAQIQNNETGETAKIQSRILINATGAHVDRVRTLGSKESQSRFVDQVAGSHIDVFPPVSKKSFYVTAKDGRLVFILCRNEDGIEYSRIGTTERTLGENEALDAIRPTSGELQYLKDLVKEFFPNITINKTNLIGTDAGIRPLRRQQAIGSEFDKSREHDIIQAGYVYHVVGVKLTDFRKVAEELIQKINWKRHGVHNPSNEPNTMRNPYSKPNLMYAEKGLSEIIEQTMPLHWDDIVFRRLGARLKVLKHQSEEKFNDLFEEAARYFGWSSQDRDREKSRLASRLES